ncbi:MAG: sarcosine oxidase subunit gamma [Alphaproteobacteria bacterium]|nr:sarcosine oxidase subunit gamma [Alphaproteobacteria bacterium]
MANPLTAAVARTALETRADLPTVRYTQITLEERPLAGKINLRGKAEDRAFAAAAARGLGDLVLPMEATSSTARGDLAVLWLGPDEWLISCPDAETTATLAALEDALAGLHHSAVDVSDNWTVLRIAGEGTRRVLSKLVAVDLHPRGFRPGDVLQTPVGKADSILYLVAGDADAATVDIHVRRSFADYAWRALANAAEEYGIAV